MLINPSFPPPNILSLPELFICPDKAAKGIKEIHTGSNQADEISLNFIAFLAACV